MGRVHFEDVRISILRHERTGKCYAALEDIIYLLRSDESKANLILMLEETIKKKQEEAKHETEN